MSKPTETELRTRWAETRHLYEAWGECVTEQIKSAIDHLDPPLSGGIQIPPTFRSKEEDSLIEKVFFRPGKDYPDPWNQIEDFVGTRFVLLLRQDIPSVRKAIESITHMDCQVARDPDLLEQTNPAEFDYVSLHLICRPKSKIEFKGVEIPAGLPCEVQIRTLMQHAWSEVSHSAIYKNATDATPTMKRNQAKSSALVEATGDYFENVFDEISQREKELSRISKQLIPLYTEYVQLKPSIGPIEGQLIQAYQPIFESKESHQVDEQVSGFLRESEYIGKKVAQHSKESFVFKHPSILLVYYLVYNYHLELRDVPNGLPDHLLRKVYADVGRRFPE